MSAAIAIASASRKMRVQPQYQSSGDAIFACSQKIFNRANAHVSRALTMSAYCSIHGMRPGNGLGRD